VFKKSTKQVGRTGEHYVAYFLEAAGLETIRVDGTGCDLHVTTTAGRVMRVEVKTCMTSKDDVTYRFHRGRSNSEVFAYVAALQEPLVRLYLRKDAPKWSMNRADFTLEAQQADLEWFLQLK
jgi:hypothetical protein